jgi:hypothetical protein
MSDQEEFLARWSRRKLEGGREHVDEKKDDKKDVTADHRTVKQTEERPPATPAAATAAFDLSKLPPVESITATTDIRPFLLPGVPQALRNAALRRAWSVDPTTRDYIEMAEYAWDFTVDNAAMGFGSLKASEVPRIVERLTRPEEPEHAEAQKTEAVAQSDEKQDESEPPAERTAPPSHEPANAEVSDFQLAKADNVQASMLQRSKDMADENAPADRTEQDIDSPPAHRRRGHGGALPR